MIFPARRRVSSEWEDKLGVRLPCPTMKLRHSACDDRKRKSSRKRCASSGLPVAPGSAVWFQWVRMQDASVLGIGGRGQLLRARSPLRAWSSTALPRADDAQSYELPLRLQDLS